MYKTLEIVPYLKLIKKLDISNNLASTLFALKEMLYKKCYGMGYSSYRMLIRIFFVFCMVFCTWAKLEWKWQPIDQTLIG